MRPINKTFAPRRASTTTNVMPFQSGIPYQAEIVKITGLDDDSDFFTVAHKINVDGQNIIYPEKFFSDLNDDRVKEFFACLAPSGITAQNLEDAIGLHEEVTMEKEWKRGRFYWNI